MRRTIVAVVELQVLLVLGCDERAQFSPSFTTIEVADQSTGQKVTNVDLSAIGIAIRYPEGRTLDEVQLRPTDEMGQTVIPIGVIGREDSKPIGFNVVIGNDTIHISNKPHAVGLGESFMILVIDTSTEPPDLKEPLAILNSSPTAIAIGDMVSQIVLCSNANSTVAWRLESNVTNGRFVSDVVVGVTSAGFIDTTLDGGTVTPDGERLPPNCPFGVLSGTGSTIGILGPFNLGEFRRSSIEVK